TVVAVHGDAVELDRTVFYPLAGGQAGDSGTLDGRRVLDTRKGPAAPDSVLHILEPGAAPTVGSTVHAALDWERRHRLMRLHSALHLLGAVVKAPVTGGRIGEDKAHLDFDVDMSRLVADQIAGELNDLVQRAVDTRVRWITDAELDAHPELVKTMSVAPPRG